MIETLTLNHKGLAMLSHPRAAIHVAPPRIGDQLKACVARAKSLGCRIVAFTPDETFPEPDVSVLDRLAGGEFDLVIVRAGATCPGTPPIAGSNGAAT